VLIWFDRWLNASVGSEFSMEMPICPRVGEIVSINKALLPKDYIFGDEDDESCSFDVKDVEHRMDANNIKICVNIEPRDF
jgi:hypothetical protein